MSALNSVDLPTFGSPTMPHLMPMSYSLSLPSAGAGFLRCSRFFTRSAPSSRIAGTSFTASPIVARICCFFLGRRALEHVIDHVAAPSRLRPVARVADAEAQAPKLRADVLDHAADAVVPGAAAVELELHAARREVELVVRDEHVLDRDLVVAHGGLDRLAAQVHLGHRLQQAHPASRDPNLGRLALELALLAEPRRRARARAGRRTRSPRCGAWLGIRARGCRARRSDRSRCPSWLFNSQVCGETKRVVE